VLDGARFHRLDQHPGEAVAARPGRQEEGVELADVGLRLVVARRALQLGRAADHAVQAGDEQLALGHQQHAAPVGLHDVAFRPAQPAEAAAVVDRRLGGVAQVVQVAAGQLGDQLDLDLGAVARGVDALGLVLGHGVQVRKLASRRKPVDWLFSGWNCVPTRLSRPTTAVTGPP
jgi:hypothetical protein